MVFSFRSLFWRDSFYFGRSPAAAGLKRAWVSCLASMRGAMQRYKVPGGWLANANAPVRPDSPFRDAGIANIAVRELVSRTGGGGWTIAGDLGTVSTYSNAGNVVLGRRGMRIN